MRHCEKVVSWDSSGRYDEVEADGAELVEAQAGCSTADIWGAHT